MKTHRFSLIIFILFSLVSCSPINLKNPDDVGKKAFKMLKNINNHTDGHNHPRDQFIDGLISYYDLKIFGEKNNIKSIISLNLLEFADGERKGYNDIKYFGGENGIDWEEITYIDYVYESTTDPKGTPWLKGELFFKFDGKTYKARIGSIYTGERYEITVIQIRNIK
ncbi:MAG: hypothetical protein QM478_04100 [Flavobacteriaceae bacterium]